MACGMPKPCKFPSLDSCQKRTTHKEVDLVPHPVVGLVVRSRRCGEVSSGTWFREPRSFFFFRVNKQGPRVTAIEDDGGDKRCVEFELAYKVDSVPQPDPV